MATINKRELLRDMQAVDRLYLRAVLSHGDAVKAGRRLVKQAAGAGMRIVAVGLHKWNVEPVPARKRRKEQG